jgi:hypothetical protein
VIETHEIMFYNVGNDGNNFLIMLLSVGNKENHVVE